ncbi:MAG: RHS repeat protein [Chloroflexi bacterium]|nr:RHS repeat protein [Chloroflexota bacterium]
MESLMLSLGARLEAVAKAVAVRTLALPACLRRATCLPILQAALLGATALLLIALSPQLPRALALSGLFLDYWFGPQVLALTVNFSTIAEADIPEELPTLRVNTSPVSSSGMTTDRFFIQIACTAASDGSITTDRVFLTWSQSTSGDFDVSSCSHVRVEHRIHASGTGTRRVELAWTDETPSDPILEAIMQDAGSFPPDPTAGDPVQTRSGNFSHTHTDVAISGRGPVPTFARSFNSTDTRGGVLGPAWTHSYAIRLTTVPSDTSGSVVLTGPQGRSDRFTRDPSGSYTAPPGVYTTLVRNADQTFTATLTDATTWTFDAGGRLRRIADANSNTSKLYYNTNDQLVRVTDPAGRGSLVFAYTSGGRLQSVTDWQSPTPRVVQYTYDGNPEANGGPRLRTVVDRESGVTTYGYDGTSQRIATITDANGHVALSLAYDGSGRVASQKDARGLSTGQATTFTYTTNPDSTTTTVVTSPATSYEPAWMPAVEDTYDAQARMVKRITKPSSAFGEWITTEYGYDANANVSWVKDGRGNTTAFCYDASGHVTRRVDPAPAAGQPHPVTVFQYSGNDLVKEVQPLGVTLANPTDCSATPTLDAQGLYATDYTYDAAHNLVRMDRRYTEPGSSTVLTATVRFEYGDAANPGLVTRVIPPGGNTGASPDASYATTFAHGSSGSTSGLLQRVTDPLGNVTTYEYDAVGRRIAMFDPLGNVSGATPAEHRWEFELDRENRLRFTRAPAPNPGGARLVTESRYDGVGNLTTSIDGNGQVTRYLYDERNALQEVWESPQPWTDPASTPNPKIVTAYQYDHLGNLSRVTRATSDATYARATDYAYDGLNRPRTETEYPSWPSTAGALVLQSAYGSAGMRSTVVDQLGRTTSFGYDALNRLTGIDYADPGTPDVAYTYDLHGNRLGMTDGTGATSYEYDQLGRLLAVTRPGGQTVGYRYDRDGNRTRLIYPNAEAVAYAFDKGNRLTTLTDWANRVTSYTYAPDGLLASQTNVNGTVATYAYDNARRLTEVWNQTPGSPPTTISRHTYTQLDAVGNRLALTETLAPVWQAPTTPTTPGGLPNRGAMTATGTAPSTLPSRAVGTAGSAPSTLPSRPGLPTGPTTQTLTYAYDRLYRLTSASGGPLGATSYSYDPVGNRLTRVRGSTITNYSYDRADRITSAGGVSYAVDANGNLTARGADSFVYDQANRLTRVTTGSSTATYAYDGDGAWTSTTVGGTTTTSLYDVNRGLPIVLEDGARRYVWGRGLAYVVEGTAALVYHTDGLGSVRAITDSARAVVQTYQSDEFGAPISALGSSAQPFGFTGEPTDGEAGLVYLRARRYDPQLGRFTSRDPASGHLSASMSLHRYAYVAQRPTVLTDPTGLDPNSQGGSDNECFTTFGGMTAGYGVNIRCLISENQAGAPIVTTTPGGPAVVTVPVSAPTPPRGVSGEGGSGEAGSTGKPATWRVGFQHAHASRHLSGTGLNAEEVENAIIEDVMRTIQSSSSVEGSFWGRVTVQGRTIEYRAFPVGSGYINVGTYYLVP